MRTLERRIEALEGPRRHYRSAAEIPTAELEAMLAPLFGGRVPTNDELRTMLAYVSVSDKGEADGHA